jgi:hypothetical protein
VAANEPKNVLAVGRFADKRIAQGEKAFGFT